MNPALRLLKSLLKKINYSLIKNEPINLDYEFPESSKFEKDLFNKICPELFKNCNISIFRIKLYETPNCLVEVDIN